MKKNTGLRMKKSSGLSFVILVSLVLSGIFGTSFSKKEVMSIKTKGGVFDCVDFYKQPAFNHPMLKNLPFEEKRLPNLEKLQRRQVYVGIGLKDGGCPIGTVPILRRNSTSPNFSSPMPPSNLDNLCCSVVQTIYRDRPNKTFYGLEGSVTTWKPRVAHSQWSTARLKVKNGVESIEAGWGINPDAYQDVEAHLYAELRTTPACSPPSCTSFVQVSKDVPLGLVPDHYSGVNGFPQYYWTISIDKHEDDGNWWLTVTGEKHYETKVGYWPKQVLTTLRNGANQADWGGEVRTGPLEIQPPEMGDGMRANYDTKFSAYIFQISLVKEDYKRYLPEDTTKVWNCEDLYNVKDAGYVNDYFGRLMLYGGPWNQV